MRHHKPPEHAVASDANVSACCWLQGGTFITFEVERKGRAECAAVKQKKNNNGVAVLSGGFKHWRFASSKIYLFLIQDDHRGLRDPVNRTVLKR